jgi:hypothetical protein
MDHIDCATKALKAQVETEPFWSQVGETRSSGAGRIDPLLAVLDLAPATIAAGNVPFAGEWWWPCLHSVQPSAVVNGQGHWHASVGPDEWGDALWRQGHCSVDRADGVVDSNQAVRHDRASWD